MKRIRQHETGSPDVLLLEEVADLVPGPGQVRIAVEVAGVHLVDTTIRQGEWGDVELPMTPGREVAGRVDGLGAGVDDAWLGRRVVAHL
ncbi:MAG: oxidoreductase, partial [Actinomycetales bacterium]